MNTEELLKKARRLPLADRKAVVREISLSILEEEVDNPDGLRESLNTEFDSEVLSALLAQRIAEMTPERQVLRLSLQGYSAEDIASSLGISITTVLARLSRAQKELLSAVAGNREDKLAAFHRLKGMLKTDAASPLTDEELKNDYTKYLAEKYS